MSARAEDLRTPLPVLVCGGGPVGSTLALALARAGVRVGLVEPGASDAGAQRPIALSASSVRILDTLGVWPAIAGHACPIRMVHVSEQGRFGMVRLRAREHGVDALGHVTDAAVIARALEPALAAAPGLVRIGPARARAARAGVGSLEVLLDPPGAGEPRASLVVAADGGTSGLRAALGFEVSVRDYGQCAVVACVTPERAHDGTAYERFTPGGPLAMLPLHDGRCALVWSVPQAHGHALCALGDADFLAALQRAFGHRLGTLREAGTRHAYPLSLERCTALTATRVALAGNAANRLHPVAGQGLNLGLRDAAVLAELIADAVRAGVDPGAVEVLDAYRARRAPDHRAVVRFTDALARGFTTGPAAMGALRSAALLALDLVPVASRALARRAMGLAGRQPRLVRGAMP